MEKYIAILELQLYNICTLDCRDTGNLIVLSHVQKYDFFKKLFIYFLSNCMIS